MKMGFRKTLCAVLALAMMCMFPVTVGAEEPTAIFIDSASGFTVSLESPQAGDSYQLWMTPVGGTIDQLKSIDDKDDFLNYVAYVDFNVAKADGTLFTVKCPEGEYGKYAVRVIRSVAGNEVGYEYYVYKYVDPNVSTDAITAYMTVADDTNFAALFETYTTRGLFDSENLGVLSNPEVVGSIGDEFALVRDLVLGAENKAFEVVPNEILSCSAGAVTYIALLDGNVENARAEIAENGAWLKAYLPKDEDLESFMRIFSASKDAYEDAGGLRDILTVACEYSAHKDAEEILDMFEAIDEDFSDAEELKGVLDWSSALAGINGATREEIENSLKNNKELFGISVESKDNKGITIAQIARLFKNEGVEELYGQVAFGEYFDSLVDKLYEENSKRGSGGSIGGSSGGSGGGIRPSIYVAQPVLPENNRDDAPVKTEEAELPFSDLGGAEWAAGHIANLYKREIINGVTESSFEPDRPVTREEYVKMLVVAFNLKADKVMDFYFTDVPENSWSYPYVKTAYISGVVNGMSNDYFGAKEPITREDAAVMLYKAMKIQVSDAGVKFSDTDNISDYAKEAVAALSAKGLMTGMEDRTFVPKGQTTRAQAATMLSRALDYNGGVM